MPFKVFYSLSDSPVLIMMIFICSLGVSCRKKSSLGLPAQEAPITKQSEDAQATKDSFDSILDTIKKAKALNDEGSYKDADSLFRQAILRSEELKYGAGEVMGYSGLGQSQYYLGKYEDALSNYNKAVEINAKTDIDSLAIEIFNGIGDVLYQQGQYDGSNEYYLKSVKLAESTNDQSSLALTYQKLGKNHRFQSLYEEALRYYLASVKIANETSDKKLLAILYTNLGLLHADQKEYDLAIDYYTKSIELGDEVTERTIVLDAYFNLAGTYSDLGEFDKALAFIDTVYQYDKETGYIWGQALDLNYIGTIHFRKAEYQLAIDYYSRSLKLFEQIGAEGNYLDPLIRIATAYTELNQTDVARSYLQKALEYARKTNILEYEVHVYEYLAQAEEKAKNYKAAYENHQRYKQLADSLANQQEIKKIAKREAQFEFQLERDSIEFARETDLLAFNAEIEKKSTIQLLTSIGLAIVILLLVVIYYLYSQRTKSNQALRRSLGENQLLIKEIHHRVKNNLQIISSLLNIQSTFLKDDEAKQVVSDIQDRVISMSVVHQNLYTDTQVMVVRADSYLEKLVTSIKRTFEDPDDPIEVKLHVDAVKLQSDDAINIGLIINETVTNSLKHAFPEEFENEKEIVLSLKEESDGLQLTIRDNGVGMEQDQQEKMMYQYGWKMIDSLIRSMQATISVSNENGTSINMKIPFQSPHA